MGKFFYKRIVILALVIFLSSCGKETPEKYFNVAVLNTNLIQGFAGPGFNRQLESPSVKLSEDGNETMTMSRREVVNSITENAEESYSNVKSLKVTDDTKEMIDASIKLYEYIIPVYKNEYSELAVLYDNSAPEEQIGNLTKSIHDNYFPGFTERYSKLISAGKTYAEKNSIKVHWAD